MTVTPRGAVGGTWRVFWRFFLVPAALSAVFSTLDIVLGFHTALTPWFLAWGGGTLAGAWINWEDKP